MPLATAAAVDFITAVDSGRELRHVAGSSSSVRAAGGCPAAVLHSGRCHLLWWCCCCAGLLSGGKSSVTAACRLPSAAGVSIWQPCAPAFGHPLGLRTLHFGCQTPFGCSALPCPALVGTEKCMNACIHHIIQHGTIWQHHLPLPGPAVALALHVPKCTPPVSQFPRRPHLEMLPAVCACCSGWESVGVTGTGCSRCGTAFKHSATASHTGRQGRGTHTTMYTCRLPAQCGQLCVGSCVTHGAAARERRHHNDEGSVHCITSPMTDKCCRQSTPLSSPS